MSCSLCSWTLVFTSGIRPPSSGSSGKRSLQRRCLCLGFVPIHPVSNHFCSAGGGADLNRLQTRGVVTLDETPPRRSATQKAKQPLAFTIDFFYCVCLSCIVMVTDSQQITCTLLTLHLLNNIPVLKISKPDKISLNLSTGQSGRFGSGKT